MARLNSRAAFIDDDDDMLDPHPLYGPTDSSRRPSANNSPFPSPTLPPPVPPPYLSIYTTSPVPSRSTSPLPFIYSTAPSSTNSDSETDADAPILTRRRGWPRDRPPRWWFAQPTFRRRKRDPGCFLHTIRKISRVILRLPCCPRHPCTILITLLFFSVLAVSITFAIIYALNPDKEALPWRAYCSVPVSSFDAPPIGASVVNPDIFTVGSAPPFPPFPPDNFDKLPPTGVFVGVFSVDSSVERRMLIRSSWAVHERSRNGAGVGDGGIGTSRTIVRFILGQPRKSWERRIHLEMEQYNDIIILPIGENMNSGKSHTFFSWAATMAWVPPIYVNELSMSQSHFSYSNLTSIPPTVLAAHDPPQAWADLSSDMPRDWVRPDFVVKADDDSFVMLAELEARLRVALHSQSSHGDTSRAIAPVAYSYDHTQQRALKRQMANSSVPTDDTGRESRSPTNSVDPLIYWGYLVKQRFMAGELYALSWSLVTYAATDPAVKAHLRGAEDKQTASWMRLHPHADEIRWMNERCWIYDHPKAGTVYSHGFLFPSEVTRVRHAIKSLKDLSVDRENLDTPSNAMGNGATKAAFSIPLQWSQSSVSNFGTRYTEPLPNLSTLHSVEALIEGSQMSELHEGSILTPDVAWKQREGRNTRYDGQRVGGTVVVHFIKKNMWYLETALALLGGDDETDLERLGRRHARA